MKTYTADKFSEVLRLHKLFLNNDPAGVLAYLRYANLSGANLRYAYLRYANLSGANLRYANLRYANLSGADLNGVVGNMNEIRSMQLDKWAIAYTADRIQIGCQNANIDEWRVRTPDDVASMVYGAREWWDKWKTFIFTAIELAPASPTGYEGK